MLSGQIAISANRGEESLHIVKAISNADVGPQSFTVKITPGRGDDSDYRPASRPKKLQDDRTLNGEVQCDIYDDWALFGRHKLHFSPGVSGRPPFDPTPRDNHLVAANDIVQRDYQDCFVLAVGAAMAHHQPGKLMAMFERTASIGIPSLRVPDVVTVKYTAWDRGLDPLKLYPRPVDISMDVSLGGDSHTQGFFMSGGLRLDREDDMRHDANEQNHIELWPAILESTFASFRRSEGFGSMEHGGMPSRVIIRMTGRPSDYVSQPWAAHHGGLGAYIDPSLSKGLVAVGGTWVGMPGHHGPTVLSNGIELHRSHAYAFLGWKDAAKTLYLAYEPYGKTVEIPRQDLSTAFGAVSYEIVTGFQQPWPQ